MSKKQNTKQSKKAIKLSTPPKQARLGGMPPIGHRPPKDETKGK